MWGKGVRRGGAVLNEAASPTVGFALADGAVPLNTIVCSTMDVMAVFHERVLVQLSGSGSPRVSGSWGSLILKKGCFKETPDPGPSVNRSASDGGVNVLTVDGGQFFGSFCRYDYC